MHDDYTYLTIFFEDLVSARLGLRLVTYASESAICMIFAAHSSRSEQCLIFQIHGTIGVKA
jgi:hypothetical protein